jgi:hypothetical protein
VNFVALVPCTFISFFTEHLMKLLNMQKGMSELAGIFVRYQMFGLIPVFWHSALGERPTEQWHR